MKHILILLSLFFLLQSTLLGQHSDKIREIIKEKSIANKWKESLQSGNSEVRSNDEQKLTGQFNRATQEGEPMIAVNPNNPQHVAVSFMSFGQTSFELPLYISFDGGKTWQLSNFDALAFHRSDPSRASLNILGGGDPMMAFNDAGQLYYTWIFLAAQDFSDGQWFNYGVVSNDGGVNFQVPSGGDLIINTGGLDLFTNQITARGEGVFDRHWLDVDISDGPGKGNMYMAGLFLNGPNSTLDGPGIVVKRRLAGQPNFENDNVLLSTTPDAQFCQIQVDPVGYVHVVFGDLTRNEVVHFVSRDEGRSYSGPNKIGDFTFAFNGSKTVHDRENPAPSLAIDPVSGDLRVAWTSFEGVSPQAYYSESRNLGMTWSTSENLSSYLPDVYTGAMMPTVTTSENGITSVLFYGLRGKVGDYIHLQTEGRPQDFKPHQVVGQLETNFAAYSINNPFAETFFGDYFAADAGGCSGFGVFSDGRSNQGPKVYVATVDMCGEVSTSNQIRFNDARFRINNNALAFFESDHSGEAVLRCISSSGQTLEQRKVVLTKGKNQIELKTNLPKLTYVVQIEFEERVFVRKWNN